MKSKSGSRAVHALSALFLALALLLPAAGEAFKDQLHEFPHPQFWEVPRDNARNIAKLAPGMTREQAMSIMGGEKKITTYRAMKELETVSNPEKAERRSIGGKSYEILYFHTAILHQDSKVTDDELTPLIFSDGVLLGIGWKEFEGRIGRPAGQARDI